jgi:hypothetical protein
MYLEHEFSELGIPLDGGWTFGSINGKCTVAYDTSGEWWIEEIWLDITKLTKSGWVSNSHMLDKTKPTERRWYHVVREIIAAADKSEIDEKVSDELPDTYDYVNANSAGRTFP